MSRLFLLRTNGPKVVRSQDKLIGKLIGNLICDLIWDFRILTRHDPEPGKPPPEFLRFAGFTGASAAHDRRRTASAAEPGAAVAVGGLFALPLFAAVPTAFPADPPSVSGETPDRQSQELAGQFSRRRQRDSGLF